MKAFIMRGLRLYGTLPFGPAIFVNHVALAFVLWLIYRTVGLE